MSCMDVRSCVRDEALFQAIEWHLLKAQLRAGQVLTLERHGWFDIIWLRQFLILRVHTDTFPTVDLHQLEMRATYLCSYDVGAISPTAQLAPVLSTFSPTPLGAARLVLEAHRRDLLKPLLEACAVIRKGPLPAA